MKRFLLLEAFAKPVEPLRPTFVRGLRRCWRASIDHPLLALRGESAIEVFEVSKR